MVQNRVVGIEGVMDTTAVFANEGWTSLRSVAQAAVVDELLDVLRFELTLEEREAFTNVTFYIETIEYETYDNEIRVDAIRGATFYFQHDAVPSLETRTYVIPTVGVTPREVPFLRCFDTMRNSGATMRIGMYVLPAYGIVADDMWNVFDAAAVHRMIALRGRRLHMPPYAKNFLDRIYAYEYWGENVE